MLKILILIILYEDYDDFYDDADPPHSREYPVNLLAATEPPPQLASALLI